MIAVATSPIRHSQVIHVEGPLRAPVSNGLRHAIGSLVDNAGPAAAVVLDLADISEIDAAGVGELVYLYNRVTESNGTLRIVNPTRYVRHVLARVGLLELLTQVRL